MKHLHYPSRQTLEKSLNWREGFTPKKWRYNVAANSRKYAKSEKPKAKITLPIEDEVMMLGHVAVIGVTVSKSKSLRQAGVWPLIY